jgi:hypothetical protein
MTEALEHGTRGALDRLVSAEAHGADRRTAAGAAFGYAIDADFPLARLDANGARERGQLHIRRGDADGGDMSEIARDPDARGPTWILSRGAAGVVLSFPGLGMFRLDVDGGLVVAEPAGEPGGASEDPRPQGPSEDPEWEQRLLCTALPQLLVARGDLAVHAATLACAGRAVAFFAPSGAGKSSIALALARRGFELLCEDVLIVSGLPEQPLAWPGPVGVRVRQPSGATLLERGPHIAHSSAPAPLAAVVLVGRRHRGSTRLESLGQAHLAAAIARNASFTGDYEHRQVLARATGVAARVPGFVLRATDDLGAFEAAADELADELRALLA